MKRIILFLFLISSFGCSNKFMGGKGGKGGQGGTEGAKGKDGENGKNGSIHVKISK